MRVLILFIFVAIMFSSCRTSKPCDGILSSNYVIEEDGVIWYSVINGDSIKIKR
jgi:hypothetical protein